MLLGLVVQRVLFDGTSSYLRLIWGDGQEFFVRTEEIDECVRRGDAIVSALEVWRAEHGRYPDELGVLVPDVLDELEPPILFARAWSYEPAWQGQAYRLSFAIRRQWGYAYTRANVWPCLETSDVGGTILAAIDAWHAEHGAFPKAMSELVPDYLDADVAPAGVWRWIYVPMPDGFELIDGYDDQCRVHRGWTRYP